MKKLVLLMCSFSSWAFAANPSISDVQCIQAMPPAKEIFCIYIPGEQAYEEAPGVNYAFCTYNADVILKEGQKAGRIGFEGRGQSEPLSVNELKFKWVFDKIHVQEAVKAAKKEIQDQAAQIPLCQ